MCSEQNNWNRELSVECWFWFHSREMTIVARVLLCRTFAMSGIHRVYLLNCIEISDKLHFTCFCVYGLSCETVKKLRRAIQKTRCGMLTKRQRQTTHCCWDPGLGWMGCNWSSALQPWPCTEWLSVVPPSTSITTKRCKWPYQNSSESRRQNFMRQALKI